ncbi:MAG: hypothetical protein WCG07_00500 [Candidatus Taylorbacteria bacterium]
MLNIISRSYVEGEINGPQKVVTTLIKGLNKINYPYCINKDLTATSQVWIHDDPVAFEQACRRGIKALAGPNIYVLPRHIPKDIDLSSIVYIQPTEWITTFWKRLGFSACPIDVWPSAIDTDTFTARTQPEKGSVLIYHKQRSIEELDFVVNIFKKKNIPYQIIRYGSYEQKEYIDALKNTTYICWLGRHETQGIALEEALAMNVPALVWDVHALGHWLPRKKDQDLYTAEELIYPDVTSAEYFDERCGIKTKDKDAIERSIDTMESNWRTYTPRDYIVENLNPEKQARALINLYQKHFNISYEQGIRETMRNNKPWINDTMTFKVRSHIKALAKRILGKKG